MSVTFSAKFQLTVTVPIGTWGEDTNFSEMKKQLTREAETNLRGVMVKADYTVHSMKLQSFLGVED